MTDWKNILGKHIIGFFCIASLFIGINLSGQIDADPTEGCAPLIGVQFSSPANGTNINWNFGDGTSAITADPTHTYTQPGTYEVTYTATVNGSQVTDNLTITVNGNPNADFSSTLPVVGCVGLTVDFTDTSTGGGGSAIESREWSFGDGTTDIGNNGTPSHTYTLPGSFDVILTVTDANGCDSTVVKEDYVRISEEPSAVISTNPGNPSACEPPLTVNFSAAASSSNSPFGNDLTFSWDFGNGSQSTDVNPPAQVFTESGTFNVVLTVTDDSGCSASATQQVQVDLPVASFSILSAVDNTICTNATFINESTPGAYTWDFGDGTGPIAGDEFAIDHTFPGEGDYSVTLTVNAGACQDDTTIVVSVEEVVADFIVEPTYGCSYPLEVQYTDQSTNAVSWEWTFGDNGVSDEQNPSYSYDFTNPDPYHIYDEMPIATSLLVTSPIGCVSQINVPNAISTFIPTARFFPDVSEGCAPLEVNFMDVSDSNEDIVSWTFDYDNGDTEVFTDPDDMAYTFTDPGEYDVVLIIENTAGCIDTSYIQPIVVGVPAEPNFTINNIEVCPLDTVQFEDLTPAGDNLDTWNFDSEDGAIWHCLNESDPSWVVYNRVGLQDLTLIGGYNGCYETVTIEDAIEVTGAIGRITHACDCAAPMDYQFTGEIEGAEFWDWDFGDGDSLTESTESTVDHVYDESGDYWVKLTVYDALSSCAPFTDSIFIQVRNLTAEFEVEDTIVCVGDPVFFDSSMSADVNDTCMQGYQWYFDDGQAPFRTEDSVYTYNFGGSIEHNVRLVTKDVNGCRDTMEMLIYAYQVMASFTADTLSGCADPPFDVNFDDTSTGDTTIVSWEWDFGDGGTDEGEEVSNNFSGEGPFTVTLSVMDAVECPGTASATVIPIVPDANFNATTTRFICVGESVSFAPTTETHNAYEWDFESAGSSTDQNPTITFDEPGFYDVTLTVTDELGCRNSFTRIDYVEVQTYPDASFISWADTLEHLCYPLSANFTDDTDAMGSPYTRVWDFDNGSPTVPSETVGTQYPEPGDYNVSLVVTTSYGCADSIVQVLEVEGPTANFTLAPSPICRGQEVTFNITEQNDVAFWSWDFGDGFIESGGDPISHVYDISPIIDSTIVSLVYWSPDSACEASTQLPLNFLPIYADFNRNNGFAPADTNHCIGTPDVFTFTGEGALDSYMWDLGDGTLVEGQGPINHTYATPGVYTVTLTVEDNETGCFDVVSKDMVIQENLVVESLDVGVCEPGEQVNMLVFAAGGTDFEWSPATGLDDPNSPTPVATVNETTQYTVTVTNAAGCVGVDTVFASVYQQPTQDLLDSLAIDTMIVVQDQIPLNAYIGPGFNYSWSPSANLDCSAFCPDDTLGLLCSDCAEPIASPQFNESYIVTITDPAGCIQDVEITYNINVRRKSTIDVPTAFTPNGDGINDVIYVDGWGLVELEEFNIYNRYGQLMYQSTSPDKGPNGEFEGWDGFFEGKLQNQETYTYTAVVRDFEDVVKFKYGNFHLLRQGSKQFIKKALPLKNIHLVVMLFFDTILSQRKQQPVG